MNLIVSWDDVCNSDKKIFDGSLSEGLVLSKAPEKPIANLEKLLNQTEIMSDVGLINITNLSYNSSRVLLDYWVINEGEKVEGVIAIYNPSQNMPLRLSVIYNNQLGQSAKTYNISSDLLLTLVKQEIGCNSHECLPVNTHPIDSEMIIDTTCPGEILIRLDGLYISLKIELVTKEQKRMSIDKMFTLDQRNKLEEYLISLSFPFSIVEVSKRIFEILGLDPKKYEVISIKNTPSAFNTRSKEFEQLDEGNILIENGEIIRICERYDVKNNGSYFDKRGTWKYIDGNLIIIYDGHALVGYMGNEQLFKYMDVDVTPNGIDQLLNNDHSRLGNTIRHAVSQMTRLKNESEKILSLK